MTQDRGKTTNSISNHTISIENAKNLNDSNGTVEFFASTTVLCYRQTDAYRAHLRFLKSLTLSIVCVVGFLIVCGLLFCMAYKNERFLEYMTWRKRVREKPDSKASKEEIESVNNCSNPLTSITITSYEETSGIETSNQYEPSDRPFSPLINELSGNRLTIGALAALSVQIGSTLSLCRPLEDLQRNYTDSSDFDSEEEQGFSLVSNYHNIEEATVGLGVNRGIKVQGRRESEYGISMNDSAKKQNQSGMGHCMKAGGGGNDEKNFSQPFQQDAGNMATGFRL